MTENVLDHRFEVFHLTAPVSEISTGEGVGVNDLEIENRGVFLAGNSKGTSAQGGNGAADEAPENFIEQAHAVAFVTSERKEGGDFVRVCSRLAVGIDGGTRRQRFPLAFQGLDAAHGDGGSGPVHDDRGRTFFIGRDTPRVRVGAESRKFSAEGDDLCESGRAVGVSVVATLGGFHDVAAAPKVVEGIVHGDLGDAVLIRELDSAVDGAVGDRLAEFFVGIPSLGGGETRWQNFNFCAGHATTGTGAEEVVEVQCLERVMGADARGGLLRRRVSHLLRILPRCNRGIDRPWRRGRRGLGGE